MRLMRSTKNTEDEDIHNLIGARPEACVGWTRSHLLGPPPHLCSSYDATCFVSVASQFIMKVDVDPRLWLPHGLE